MNRTKSKDKAEKVQERATMALRDLMIRERISKKLMKTKLMKVGYNVTIQTVMNWTSEPARRLPDILTIMAILGVINAVSGKEYTYKDIGLKEGPSFFN